MAKGAPTSASWKKGQSGNPKGAPRKELTFSNAIRDIFEKNPEIRTSVVAKLITLANNGDISAIKLLMQYIDGMPQQRIDHTTLGETVAPMIVLDITEPPTK